MTIVHGKPRHPQSQGSVERANGDVKVMLQLWMSDNNTTHWVLGLRFVQITKSNSYHSTIECSPYFATFGREMSNGLESTIIPKEILNKLLTEEELQSNLKQVSYYFFTYLVKLY